MPDHTLAIVFRNPHPQRSSIRTELYLSRRDGSSAYIKDANQDQFHQFEELTAPHAPREMR